MILHIGLTKKIYQRKWIHGHILFIILTLKLPWQGLRGTYRLIDKTDTAINLAGKILQELNVPMVKFYLDSPVSNSGRLKSKILEFSEKWGMPVEVELIPNVDAVLAGKERIVTGDSIILDECKSWFNLSRKIIEDYIQDAWVIDLV